MASTEPSVAKDLRFCYVTTILRYQYTPIASADALIAIIGASWLVNSTNITYTNTPVLLGKRPAKIGDTQGGAIHKRNMKGGVIAYPPTNYSAQSNSPDAFDVINSS